jgi:ATP adenylyltransferase
MEYIEKEKPDGCVFCDCAAADPEEDRERFIIHRSRHHFIVLNLWPYNNGHSMICPLRHIVDVTEMTDEEALEQHHLTQRLVEAYRNAMRAQGVNVGLNLGQISGGSIDHLHLHLVPRWAGDANFMPVIGQTKILVELLADTWTRLRKEVEQWPETQTPE